MLLIRTVFKRIIKSLIIGISCFFIGILISTLSPFIALLSLVHQSKNRTPLANKWAKNFEEKLKEIRDPDLEKDWKKRHLELYGQEDEPEI